VAGRDVTGVPDVELHELATTAAGGSES
jgi:hypothetical protein